MNAIDIAAARRGKVDGDFQGPICAFPAAGHGDRPGFGGKSASMRNIYNRIMYSAGVAARRMGLVDGNVAMGWPWPREPRIFSLTASNGDLAPPSRHRLPGGGDRREFESRI